MALIGVDWCFFFLLTQFTHPKTQSNTLAREVYTNLPNTGVFLYAGHNAGSRVNIPTHPRAILTFPPPEYVFLMEIITPGSIIVRV